MFGFLGNYYKNSNEILILDNLLVLTPSIASSHKRVFVRNITKEIRKYLQFSITKWRLISNDD